MEIGSHAGYVCVCVCSRYGYTYKKLPIQVQSDTCSNGPDAPAHKQQKRERDAPVSKWMGKSLQAFTRARFFAVKT